MTDSYEIQITDDGKEAFITNKKTGAWQKVRLIV